VVTCTQPKVPEAKVRRSEESFQWGLVSLERVPEVWKGVQRGPAGHLGPPELLCWKRVMSTRKPVNSVMPVHVKSTGVQFVLVLSRIKFFMKNMTYRVLDPGFTMHACDASRDSTCMHARMSWPAVLKELLAAKYSRVVPRCRTA
jgi:hypothetical protein